MKKLTSILLTMLIILSALPIQITVSAEETNEPESPIEETGYSLNLPFYLDDQEARCFLGFLFDTRELTQEQITNGNAYVFLTGQLSGDNEIESGFAFKDLMDAQLSRVVDTYEYGTEVGKQWMLDYLYLKAKKTPNLAQSIVSETLHTISSNGIDYILDEYTVHGGPLQEMEFEYIQDGHLIKGLYDKITSVPGKVDYYKKMMLALAGSAFYTGGTNRLEMYKYFLFCKDNMVYRHKYSEEIYQLVLSQQGLNEHVVAIRAIQPTLANWDFLDENMLLWGTEERMALMEKWADFAYCLEDGLSQFPKNEFIDEGTTSSTDPTATNPDETEPVTQPTTTLPDIDETHSGKIGDCSWYLNTRIGTLYIMGSGAMASYSSASSYPWYEYRGYIKQISLNNTVTNIGSYAFSNCYNLEKTNLPTGLKSIGSYAFSGCSKVDFHDLKIPDGVSSIGQYAFSDCAGVTGIIEVPKSVQSIGQSSFRGTNPTKMILPFVGVSRNAKYYGSTGYAETTFAPYFTTIFGYNEKSPDSLTEVEITDADHISSYSFKNSNNVTNIRLNEGITEIHSNAFYDKTNLETINIPSTVISIGSSAFYNCSGLTGMLVLPQSLTQIGSAAFYNCAGLIGTLVLPQNLTQIGSSAFYNCTGLSGEVTVPEGVTAIEASVFRGCNQLEKISLPTGITYIGEYAFSGCSKADFHDLKIPDGVSSIGQYAFSDCAGVTGIIEVPKSVQSIGQSSFRGTNPTKMILPFVGVSRNAKYYGSTGYAETTFVPYFTTIFGYNEKSPDSLTEVEITDADHISSYSFKNSNNVTNIRLNEGITEIHSNAFYDKTNLETINIPSTVISIGSSAFYNCSGLTGMLVLPQSLTQIGSAAFYNCAGLIGTLVLPQNLTQIGSSAFYNCTGLSGEVTVPEGVTAIEASVFRGCNQLEKISLPTGITYIGEYAFSGCSKADFHDLKIPDGVSSIGQYAFSDCAGVTGIIEVPKSVQSIGQSSFRGTNPTKMILPFVGVSRNAKYYGSTGYAETTFAPYFTTIFGYNEKSPDSLTEVEITDADHISSYSFKNSNNVTNIRLNEGITEIHSNAFYDKTNLETINIPSTVISIGSSAFYNCSGLTGMLVLPQSLTQIGSAAFYNCAGLIGTLVLPQNLTQIGSSAFYNCTGLSGEVTVPEGVTAIEASVFRGCNQLEKISLPTGITYIGEYAFSGCSKADFHDLKIPDGVSSIGQYAFSDCAGVTGIIEVPKSVQSIGQSSFRGTNPTKMILPFVGVSRNAKYYGSTGYAETTFAPYFTTIFGYNEKSPDSLTEVEITDADHISSYSFKNSNNVTNIRLNQGITEIHSNAFYDKTNLETINIPSTVISIGSSAFYNCSGLTGMLVLPQSLTQIGSAAFYNCAGLIGTLVLPQNLTQIGSSAFYNCTGLSGEVTVPEGVTAIEASVFRGCNQLEKISLPTGITYIGEYAFSGCSKADFHDLKIPDGVSSIGQYAFSDCAGVTGIIEVPKSVQSIGQSSFRGTNPTKMILPFVGVSRNAKYYGSTGYAETTFAPYFTTIFGYNEKSPDSLTEVEITDADHISSYSFKNSNNVTNIRLNEGITEIHSNAFYDKTNLETINIPSTVTSIGNSAFYNCTGLKKAYYYGNDISNITISSGNEPLLRSLKYMRVGDVNFDGCVNVNDVTAIQRHLVELEPLDENQLLLADTNGDGEIDIADATHLQMYLAEYDVKLG